MPLVSIILTSYNHEKFIALAIESVLAQTFTDYELIIVDDCSTDSSWDIINSFSDQRIIKLRTEVNNGILLPHYLEYCTGKYIAIHHSDDLWMPDKIAKQVEFLEANSDYVAVFTHVEIINKDGFLHEQPGYMKNIFIQPNRTRFEWLRYFFEKSNALCHPSILIQRNIYYSIAKNYLPYSSLPDFYFWVNLCLKHEIFILQEKLTFFRLLEHGKNMSGDRVDNIIRYNNESYFLLNEFMKINNKNDFLQAFPDAEKYLVDDKIVIPFAFARLLIDNTNSKQRQMLGLQILHNIIREEGELASKIQKLYSYDYRSFNNEIGRYDIFSAIDEKRYLNFQVSIYYENGDNQHLQRKVYINNQMEFFLDIIVAKDNKPIKEIHFTPEIDKQKSRGYLIIEAKIDDVNVVVIPKDSICNGEYDLFINNTPMYLIKCTMKKLTRLSIFGKVDSFNYQLLRNDVFLFPFERINKNSNIVLYGMGKAGNDYLNQINKSRYCKVVAVLDENHANLNRYTSHMILPPKEIMNIASYDNILITVQSHDVAKKIGEDLLSYGVTEERIIHVGNRNINYQDIPNENGSNFIAQSTHLLSKKRQEEIKKQLIEYGRAFPSSRYNKIACRKAMEASVDKIDKVLSLLQDDQSKAVFTYELLSRKKMKNMMPSELIEPIIKQYFDPDIIKLSDDEIFIDAGAYDGATTTLLMQNVNPAKVYLFEPDEDMYKIMMKKSVLINTSNIEFIRAGLSDKKGIARFSMLPNGSSHITDEGEKCILTVALDDMFDEVTFIKMDIEGAEYKALIGAKKIIQTARPKLAIAIYHNIEDMWEIPLLVHSLCPEYKLYIRKYEGAEGHFLNEVILYAVI